MSASLKRGRVRETLKGYTPSAIILNEPNPAASDTPLGCALVVISWGANSKLGIPYTDARGRDAVVAMACEYFVVTIDDRLFAVPRALDHDPLHKLEQVFEALDPDDGYGTEDDDEEWGSQGGEPDLDGEDGGDNEAL